ncbi:uncharacterized protein [Haliotis asinina]|uniref:uncharacterized protein n=1 Tax=Haliotis asinina TaxID=109174 RepID=UPI0035327ED0
MWRHDRKGHASSIGICNVQDHVNCEIYEEMRTDYSEMTALLALQCEYSKYLTLSQYRCRTSREDVLVSYLTDFFTSQVSIKTDQSAVYITGPSPRSAGDQGFRHRGHTDGSQTLQDALDMFRVVPWMDLGVKATGMAETIDTAY